MVHGQVAVNNMTTPIIERVTILEDALSSSVGLSLGTVTGTQLLIYENPDVDTKG